MTAWAVRRGLRMANPSARASDESLATLMTCA